MKKLITVVNFLAALYLVNCIGDENILCSDAICKKTKCTPVPAECKNKKNASACVQLLSPDICNCCDYYLVNLGEGEDCSIGDPSNAKHTSICGPGLTCVPIEEGETDGTCKKMSTPCALEQQSYDKRRQDGFLGTMETRVACDEDGLYGTYKCIPGQTCYCLRSNGSRIFGEANFNTIPNYMPCECSRKYYDAVDLLGRDLHPHEHFRCTSEGNYDRVQCINGRCLCVDAADGAPTYPDAELVDMEDVDSESLPCYTSKKSGQYYKPCEKEFIKVYEELQEKKELGYNMVFGYTLPTCDLDGTYLAVQENKTHKYCADKRGKLLLALNKSDSSLKTLISNMDCKCARAMLIMTTAEKPDCLPNGNFNPVQCRRGVCRCVDSDGNQKCSSPTNECEELDESQSANLKC